jgi:hypothetical protein
MKHYFEATGPIRGIDPDEGIVYGATVCQAGVTAKGHDLETDRVLLSQLLRSAQSKGTVPVGLDHKSGVKGAAGAARNFQILGDKLVADLHFFKTHPDFPLIMDQLQELGGTMGLSASFTGGSEDGKARCNDLLATDLVLNPAACPNGLFAANYEDSMNEHDENENDETEPSMEELCELLHSALDHVETLTDHIGNLEELLEHLIAEREEDDSDSDDEDDEDEEPVIEEKGIRASGPGRRDMEALPGMAPRRSSLDGTNFDFESAVQTFRMQGKSEKDAHCLALRSFANAQYGVQHNL